MTNSDRTMAGIEYSPVTLADFLLARIAEDEARARRTVWVTETGPGKSHVGDQFRLAECEAKRRIVDLHAPTEEQAWSSMTGLACIACVGFHADMDCEQAPWPCPTVRALALPYADHPDYRDEWRG